MFDEAPFLCSCSVHNEVTLLSPEFINTIFLQNVFGLKYFQAVHYKKSVF